MRIEKTITLPQIKNLEDQLLQWSRREPVSCMLTSNTQQQAYGNFDLLLGVGAHSAISCEVGQAFENLSAYRTKTKDWVLGFLTYDLKNELETLESSNRDTLNFPALFFFQPVKLIKISGNKMQFLYLESVADAIERDYKAILDASDEFEETVAYPAPKIKLRFNKDAYCKQVSTLLDHIKRGDIYEANFCQEFYADGQINPVKTFLKLNEKSKAPFAAYFRMHDQYALCSSTERYLQKSGTQLISQPIKGTAKRGATSAEDQLLSMQLEQDPKERAENIMITDLVRNDLSRIAEKGSVAVTELCKVYSFEQVHQMISTVKALVNPMQNPVECIAQTYPMGSMTGAPKVSAMQLIEALENTKRGLYSGSIGYFDPVGNFDFNVVIRSILYNAAKSYVSFSVGSAITAQAIPEKEYEECLLKAKAMRETLES